MLAPSSLPAPIWSRGRSALYLGDCYPLLCATEGDTFDAVVTDCPYNSGGMVRGDRTQSTSAKYVVTGTALQRPDFSGDNRDQRGFLAWAALWLGECRRVTKPGGYLLAFIDWRMLPTLTDAVQAGGWVWRGIVPWDKGEGTRPQRGWFRAQCEYVLTCSNGPMGPEQERAVDLCAAGLFRHVRRAEDREHITGKPVALMRDLMQVIPGGSRVLDRSTLVAGLQLGLDVVGMEQTPYYAEIAAGRVAQEIPGGFA